MVSPGPGVCPSCVSVSCVLTSVLSEENVNLTVPTVVLTTIVTYITCACLRCACFSFCSARWNRVSPLTFRLSLRRTLPSTLEGLVFGRESRRSTCLTAPNGTDRSGSAFPHPHPHPHLHTRPGFHLPLEAAERGGNNRSFGCRVCETHPSAVPHCLLSQAHSLYRVFCVLPSQSTGFCLRHICGLNLELELKRWIWRALRRSNMICSSLQVT